MTDTPQHTPGLLHIRYDRNLIAGDDHSLTSMQGPDGHHERAAANARRAAACWNACEVAGIPTKALEAGVVPKLLAALEGLSRTWESAGPSGSGQMEKFDIVVNKARAAIAEAKGDTK